jgi:Flp pilus assembly protein TadD
VSESTYDTFRRGRHSFHLGDYIGAAKILATVAEAEPTNRTVLELLGRAYFHSAQLRRAEATFRRLIELDPVDSWAHAALARSLERQGREEEAGPHRRLHAAMSGGSRD